MSGDDQFKSIEDHELERKPKIDFLLATATEVEREAMLAHFQALEGMDAPLKIFSGVATYYVGKVGRHNCILVTSEKGAGGRSGAALVANAAIDAWKPYATIAVGIAFGVDENKPPNGGKQEMLDVLVSEKLVPYEIQRISKDEPVFRGPKPECGQVLLDRVKHLGWTWKTASGEVRKPIYGSLLAGDKLVDNLEFRNKLIEQFPDAVGGEMEGYGIYSASERNRIEWIVIKTICDWGDGEKKKAFQKSAAENSAGLVARLLSEPGLSERQFRPQAVPASSEVIKAFGSETAVTRIRETERNRYDANARFAEFMERLPLSDGRRKVPKEAQGEYSRLSAARDAANESWLNAYNDASAKYLNGSLDKTLFRDQFLSEVRQIFEIDGPHSSQLRPRAKSLFDSLWKVYTEWGPTEKNLLNQRRDIPRDVIVVDKVFESMRLLCLDSNNTEVSLEDGWVSYSWHPVDDPVMIALNTSTEGQFRNFVERTFLDDRTSKTEAREQGMYVIAERNPKSDYHRKFAISTSGAIAFKSRVGRGVLRVEPLGYVLLDLVRFLLVVREFGFAKDYPGPGILCVHLRFPVTNLVRETPQRVSAGEDGIGFDRGTLAVTFPTESKPRYGTLSVFFSLHLRDISDDNVPRISSEALGLAIRDYFGASVDSGKFVQDASDILDGVNHGRRFWMLQDETG